MLVNNAGVFVPQPVFEIPDAEWERHVAVNVMPGVRPCRHHVPRTVRRGWGRVVLIPSESALRIDGRVVRAIP